MTANDITFILLAVAIIAGLIFVCDLLEVWRRSRRDRRANKAMRKLFGTKKRKETT